MLGSALLVEASDDNKAKKVENELKTICKNIKKREIEFDGNPEVVAKIKKKFSSDAYIEHDAENCSITIVYENEKKISSIEEHVEKLKEEAAKKSSPPKSVKSKPDLADDKKRSPGKDMKSSDAVMSTPASVEPASSSGGSEPSDAAVDKGSTSKSPTKRTGASSSTSSTSTKSKSSTPKVKEEHSSAKPRKSSSSSSTSLSATPKSDSPPGSTLPPVAPSSTADASRHRVARPLRKLGTKPEPASFHAAKSKLVVHVLMTDITKLRVDVIVNAANSYLDHGAGVARAIAKAGGRRLYEDCDRYIRKHNRVDVTKNMISVAGNLHCKNVIHAVGPNIAQYRSDQRCFDDAMKTFDNVVSTAKKNNFTSIAIPAISSGELLKVLM